MFTNDETIAKTEAYADRLNDMQCALGRIQSKYPDLCITDITEIRHKLDKAKSEVYIKVTQADFINWEVLLNEAYRLLTKTIMRENS